MRPYKMNRDNDDSQWPPLYRSYGVKLKKTPHQRAVEIFYIVLATLFLATLLGIAVFVIVMIFMYSTPLTVVLMSSVIAFLVLFVPMRMCARRIRFSGKLRRFCKRNGYTLTVKRRFPVNLWHKDENEDFSVDTGRTVYYVSFLTCPKKSSRLTFLKKDKIRRTTRTGTNKLYMIYGIKQKDKDKDFLFPYVPKDSRLRKNVGVILIDPMPSNVFALDKDGTSVSIGTGDEAFGYRILNCTGFINTVDRESRE